MKNIGWIYLWLAAAAAALGTELEWSVGSKNGTFSWMSRLDHRYELSTASNLVSNAWKPIGERMIGDGEPISVDVLTEGSQGFYRLDTDPGPMTTFMWNLGTAGDVDPAFIKGLGANAIWVHGDEAWFPEQGAVLETNHVISMPNYKTASWHSWLDSHPHYTPRTFIPSIPKYATSTVHVVDLMADHGTRYELEDDPFYFPYWKVWNYTTGEEVPAGEWSVQDGIVTISPAVVGDKYNAAFSVIDLYGATRLDMSSTNAQQLVLDAYQEIMDEDVASLFRPTQFAFHFINHEFPTGSFYDWYGAGAILSRFFIERYEQMIGKPFDLDVMFKAGALRSSNDEYHEGYRDMLRVQQTIAFEFAQPFSEGFHQRGRNVRMFWGDTWVGLEPQSTAFTETGFDQVVTGMADPQRVRGLMSVDPSVRRAIRFGFWGTPTGSGVAKLETNWQKFLRAALRTFPEGMNVGGPDVSKLLEEEVGFEELVADCYADFKMLYDLIHGEQAYTNGLKVAVLNSWGALRAWPKAWTASESQAFWKALVDLPIDVQALSFAEVEANGIPNDIDVVLNIGEAYTAWAGGDEWTPTVAQAVEQFVSNGGGFIGVDGSGANSGAYPLQDLLGIRFTRLISNRSNAGVYTEHDLHRYYWTLNPRTKSRDLILSPSTASLLGCSTNTIGTFDYRSEIRHFGTPEEQMDEQGYCTRRLFGAGQAWYVCGLPETEMGWDFLKRLIYEASGNADLRKQLDCETLGGFVYYYPEKNVLLAFNYEASSEQLMLDLGALDSQVEQYGMPLTPNTQALMLTGASATVSVPRGQFAAWRLVNGSGVVTKESFVASNGTFIESMNGWTNFNEQVGDGTIQDGALELKTESVSLAMNLPASYTLSPGETEADHVVDELWAKFRIQFDGTSTGSNLRFGFGSSTYQGAFGRYATVHWQMISSATQPSVFRINSQDDVTQSDPSAIAYDGSRFADVVIRLTQNEDQLQTDVWFDPAEGEDLGEPFTTSMNDYLNTRVIDRIDLQGWRLPTAETFIDSITVGTSLLSLQALDE